MSIFHKDIVPRLLQAEAQFSTLNLTGRIPGPRYEDFDAVIDRANKWLSSNPSACIISVEVVEVDGVYSPPTAADFQAQLVSTSNHGNGNEDDDHSLCKGVPSFLRILRLWYTNEVHSNQPCSKYARILNYENIIPCRLESTPRAFGPKFQNLAETMNLVNKKLHNEDFVDGEIISVQTCAVRFHSQHCGMDPDRMFWMAENPEDVHICYFFRIFFLQDMHNNQSLPPKPSFIGYKDFPPNYVWRGKKKRDVQSDSFSDLVSAANEWLLAFGGIKLINVQTLDHHAYFRCARDSPGQEMRVLDNPHFRSSLAGLMHYTKVLRLFYRRDDDISDQAPPPSLQLPIACKVFHIEHCVCCEQVRLGSCHYFNQLPLATHREVLSRVNEWLVHNKVNLVGAETVKLTTSHTKSSYSANETHFQSCGQGSAYSLYALRLYVTCHSSRDPSHLISPSIDFNPEPKTIRLTDSNCLIL